MIPAPELDDRVAPWRCPVNPDIADAVVRIGRREFVVKVLDTSRVGFTILVGTVIAKRILAAKKSQIFYRCERWEVATNASFETEDGVEIAMTRVRDLTRIKSPRSHWWLSAVPRFNAQSDPTFLFYVVLAIILASLSLPGIGDSLGTARYVQKGVKTILPSH